MQRIFTTIVCLLMVNAAHAQLSSGMIAHWPFSNNSTDSTGNGFNGTPNSITYGPGKTPKTGNAAIFNGTSSYISAPYKSALNITEYSICAIVKPTGFYTGLCQTNAILWRGAQYSNGYYSLMFFENAYDTANCNFTDTTKEVFRCDAGTYTGNITQWKYSPNIISNTWYTVVGTFKADTFRTYVNGVLKSTFKGTGAIGTSTDSLHIGADYLTGTGYPYWFKGYIDDLRLYNRVLTDSEIKQYDTLGLDVKQINSELSTIELYPNPSNGNFTIKGSISTGKTLRIDILNTVGQIIYSENATAVNSMLNKKVQLDNVSRGMYYVRLSTETDAKTMKILIE